MSEVETGVLLLRRYRISMVVPVLIDIPLAVWLILTWRFVILDFEGEPARLGPQHTGHIQAVPS